MTTHAAYPRRKSRASTATPRAEVCRTRAHPRPVTQIAKSHIPSGTTPTVTPSTPTVPPVDTNQAALATPRTSPNPVVPWGVVPHPTATMATTVSHESAAETNPGPAARRAPDMVPEGRAVVSERARSSRAIVRSIVAARPGKSRRARRGMPDAPSGAEWSNGAGLGGGCYLPRFCMISRMSAAVSDGVLPTLTPAASRASFLACAVPDEPDTIAPA